VPTVPALHSEGAGARPPVVLMRWMNFVPDSRSPFGPGVDFAESSSQSIAVGSTLTPLTRVPTAVLPSFACHVGPRKCVMITLSPSYRSARGATKPHVKPPDTALHV
jgi:hypothetical protein